MRVRFALTRARLAGPCVVAVVAAALVVLLAAWETSVVTPLGGKPATPCFND